MTAEAPASLPPAPVTPLVPAGRGIAPAPIRTDSAMSVAPLAVSMSDAGKLIGVSARTVARLIADGRLRAVKLNGRVVVPVEGLKALLT